MTTWLEDLVNALENLGGVASLQDIYKEIENIRVGRLSEHWQANVRAIIEDFSSDSIRYKNKQDVFFSAEGIGGGVWGLRSAQLTSPKANDIEIQEENDVLPPQRTKLETYRILRDTQLARTLKALHKDTCQLCGTQITLLDGKSYSEAHHIKPLGKNHSGLDVAENILVLCPNCHVKCDYGAIMLSLDVLRLHPSHKIGNEFIEYHNKVLVKQNVG
jgi:hypothetical protein